MVKHIKHTRFEVADALKLPKEIAEEYCSKLKERPNENLELREMDIKQYYLPPHQAGALREESYSENKLLSSVSTNLSGQRIQQIANGPGKPALADKEEVEVLAVPEYTVFSAQIKQLIASTGKLSAAVSQVRMALSEGKAKKEKSTTLASILQQGEEYYTEQQDAILRVQDKAQKIFKFIYPLCFSEPQVKEGVETQILI